MTTDAVSGNKSCPQSPEYSAIIDFAARHAYSPQLLGNIDELKNKYNCEIEKDPSKAAELAGKELESLHPGFDFQSHKEDISDRFDKVGIGSALSAEDGKLTISETLDGGPARSAGLQRGDRITSVDGKSLDGLNLQDGNDLLRSGRNPEKTGNIGAGLKLEPNGPVVVNRLETNGAAERAGLKVGDKLLAVDGQPVHRESLVDSVRKLKGQEGAPVNLLVERAGQQIAMTIERTPELYPQAVIGVAREGKHFEVSVDRKRVEMKSVNSFVGGEEIAANGLKVPDDVAYIGVRDFMSHNAVAQLWSAMQRPVNDKGVLAGNSDAVVLDLRSNSGGKLSDVTLAASLFMNQGDVFKLNSRTPGDPANVKYVDETHSLLPDSQQVTADGAPDSVVNKRMEAMKPGQIIVLTNRYTAGAAEMLAAALKENAGATVIGEQTYGLGEVRAVHSTDNFKSTIGVPVARIYTPSNSWLGNGRDIKNGINPDIAVTNDNNAEFGSRTDSQLQEAFKLIEFKRSGK